jgi:PLP dependent protein
VPARLDDARRRIVAAGGDPARVRVVAVTKGFGPDAVEAALAAGLLDVGENYAQELVAKHRALGEAAGSVRWHFLGAVQRNKVPALAPLVTCWQSLARLPEGAAIARRRPGSCVLVEVELTGQPGRNGCPPADVVGLVDGLRSLELEVRGLMTVAPADREAARAAFRTVRELADSLELEERSMGMTDDLEEAVAEGSTMVRLGRALFGERPARK